MSTYKSQVSELEIDAANYIAEMICQKYAFKNEIGKLPQRFWTLPKFKQKYIMEISQAKTLLKKYNERAIIKAVNDNDARFIMSLRNKNLIPIIEKHQTELKTTEFQESEEKEFKERPQWVEEKKKNQNRLQDL